ncbi:MAG TPA: maleylpyruvate isomerase family mycothiol-dependent enzyme [Micropruina sp.]|nr:maleylpyruvate isomerase family mycothiol-dependent enzyme [Micropruina sp.]
MTAQTFSAPLETLRKRVQEATQRLLGDTIGISDDDWNGPSGLPGWSRAHVAAHLAANADALAGVLRAAMDHRESALYPDAAARLAGIERGSSLTGLELQISLDTSAGRLERVLDDIDDPTLPVHLPGRSLTVTQVAMARLSEVIVHHLDLNCDFGVDRVEQSTGRWLLQWALLWHAEDFSLPSVRVESTSGLSAELGAGEPVRTVTGDDAALWAWLVGRSAEPNPEGEDAARPIRVS